MLIIVAAALAACAESPEPAAADGIAGVEPQSAPAVPATVPPAAAAPTPRAAAADAGVKPGDPLYPDASDVEVAWLRKNDYPSAAQWRATSGRVANLATIDLDDGIDATELLDLELLAADERTSEQATAQLNQAAAMGSMYALEVLGRVHAANKNYVWSEAYYRAAQFRGNWRAAFRMQPALPPLQDILASVMAQQIIDNANEARRRHGLGPLVHDARPGAEQAMLALRRELESGHQEARESQ